MSTEYNPPHVNSFTKTALLFNAQGVNTTVTPETSANLDLVLTADHLITGAEVVISGAVNGDYITLQVLAGETVVNQYATNWYVASGTYNQQYDVCYPAKLYAGLILRLVYNSIGTEVPVFVAINYKLHKVLV